MNKWIIRSLNFWGGFMFATGSLWFLNFAIQQNSFSLQAEMCVNNPNGCPNLEGRHDLVKETGKNLWLYCLAASVGAGLACLRESKD